MEPVLCVEVNLTTIIVDYGHGVTNEPSGYAGGMCAVLAGYKTSVLNGQYCEPALGSC